MSDKYKLWDIEPLEDLWDEGVITGVDLAKIDADVTSIMGPTSSLFTSGTGADSPVLTIETLTAAMKKLHEDYPKEILMDSRRCFGFPEDESVYQRSPGIYREGRTVLIKTPETFWIPPDTCRFEFPNAPIKKVLLRESRMELMIDIQDELTTPAEVAFGYRQTGSAKEFHENLITYLVVARMTPRTRVTDLEVEGWWLGPHQKITLNPMISNIPFTMQGLSVGMDIMENPLMPRNTIAFLNGAV